LHDLASQPSCDQSDQQYDQQTFTRHVHLRVLPIHLRSPGFLPGEAQV